MTKYKSGDIVLIAFPFTDLSGSKVRPCAFISNDKEDFLAVFITTQKDTNKNIFTIYPDTSNNLKHISYARYTKMATLSTHSIFGRIGSLSKKDFTTLKKEIKDFID